MDQSDGETRAPVPVAVQDHQTQTRSKRKYRLASNYSILGGRKGWRKVCGRSGSEGEEEAGDSELEREEGVQYMTAAMVKGYLSGDLEGCSWKVWKPHKFHFMFFRNLEFVSSILFAEWKRFS